MKKALIAIDLQEDFVSGALGTPEARAIIPGVIAKIKDYQDNNHDVIFTFDTHDKDYLNTREGANLPVEHCIKNTPGWELYGEIKSGIDFDRCVKFEKNTFGSIELGRYICDKQYDQVELIGLCSGICVIANAVIIKSFCPEIKIITDKNRTACVTPETHETAYNAMKLLQLDIV
jgi:nicotinamidase-related amidase